MFIDYVTLMLINMVSGFVILAVFLLTSFNKPDRKNWTPAFVIVGLVASICGFAIIFSWPLPRPYNSPYGEMSVFFGMLFLASAYTTAKNQEYLPLGIYSFFAGLASALIGIRIMQLGLTSAPLMSGIGFIVSGACGIFAGPVIWLKENRSLRIIGAIFLFIAAGIWAVTGYWAYWMHLIVPK
jgi:putative membrane protein